MASRAILSNFFEEHKTQNHPQYLSGLSRALFTTTLLERAVCIWFDVEMGNFDVYLRDSMYMDAVRSTYV